MAEFCQILECADFVEGEETKNDGADNAAIRNGA